MPALNHNIEARITQGIFLTYGVLGPLGIVHPVYPYIRILVLEHSLTPEP